MRTGHRVHASAGAGKAGASKGSGHGDADAGAGGSAPQCSCPGTSNTVSTIFAEGAEAWAAGVDSAFVWHFQGGSWISATPPGGPGVRDLGGRHGDLHAAGDPPPSLRVLEGADFSAVADAPQTISYSRVWVSDAQVWAVAADGTVIRRPRAP